MKLSFISFQNPGKEKHSRFSDIYEQTFSNESDEKFRQAVQATLALLRYLEDDVDAPEHWIYLSHGDLMFYSKDIENFNSDFHDARRIQVGMSEEKSGVYQVGSRTTNDVRIAGEWVRCALEAETQNQRPKIQDQFPNRTGKTMIPTLNGATAGGGLALPQFVQLAAQNGFIGIEYSIEEAARLVAQTSFAEVAAIFETPMVLPVVFGLPVEWRKDEDTFQEGLAKLPALAKLAQDLDCTRCTTHVMPDGGLPVEEYATTSIRRFGQIGRVLSDQGVRLGLEFVGPHHYRTDPSNIWFYDIPGALDVVAKVQDAYQLENLGLLVDCFHWYTSGGTTMDLASIPIEQIVHVHINDAPNVPLEQQQDMTRLLPGEGVIDLNAFLQTLNAVGYDGPVAVETFSSDLKKMPPEQSATLAGQAVHNAFVKAGIKPLHLM